MRISAGVIGLHGAKLLLALSLALVIYGASGASKGYGSERQKVSEAPRPGGTSSAPSSEMTWTRRDLPGKLPGKYRLYFLENVAYGNGIFVAVGDWGTILTSRDGVKWTQQHSGTDEDLQGVAYGNGTFVVVGRYGGILTSQDGATWTAQASPAWVRYQRRSLELSLNSITYGNGLFVAVAVGSTVFASRNGVRWEWVKRPSVTSSPL